MGNHTWATVCPLPPVLNSHPEAWLGVSLRDRLGGRHTANQHPLPQLVFPSWFLSQSWWLHLCLFGVRPACSSPWGPWDLWAGVYECASHYLEDRGEESGQAERASWLDRAR